MSNGEVAYSMATGEAVARYVSVALGSGPARWFIPGGLSYSKSLSKEVIRNDVCVVRVLPQWIDTEAAVALAERLAKDVGTDCEGA
jgi:hypothetical protein